MATAKRKKPTKAEMTKQAAERFVWKEGDIRIVKKGRKKST